MIVTTREVTLTPFALEPLLKALKIGWLVGCFGFNCPLRQYFSLYRGISQREGEREEKRQRRVKMSKQPPSTPTVCALGPCPKAKRLLSDGVNFFALVRKVPVRRDLNARK